MLSENGKPAEPFAAVAATLEDFYFTTVNGFAARVGEADG
jgi:hypothetical protein